MNFTIRPEKIRDFLKEKIKDELDDIYEFSGELSELYKIKTPSEDEKNVASKLKDSIIYKSINIHNHIDQLHKINLSIENKTWYQKTISYIKELIFNYLLY